MYRKGAVRLHHLVAFKLGSAKVACYEMIHLLYFLTLGWLSFYFLVRVLPHPIPPLVLLNHIPIILYEHCTKTLLPMSVCF